MLWPRWQVIEMIRYDVKFPPNNPTSPEGLPEELTWRANLRLKSHLHAPLMRILDAIEGKAKAGHLLDLALEGSKLRYGLMENGPVAAPVPRETKTETNQLDGSQATQPSSAASVETQEPSSVKATLQARGIAKESIARFMGTQKARR